MSTRTPRSTYRLQITSSFDLFAAAGTLGYLHDLGVDWVYLSPLLEAEPDSDHGYDVVRHDRIDPARGGAEGLAALSAEARRLGLGVLVDIVPNHVGVATPTANSWWWDLLTHGQGSRYAEAFDVDWAAGEGRLLVPVIGDDDEAAVHLDAEAGVVRYHDNTYPIAPGTSSLDEQHYRLVSWRWADDRLNYRRFFAVNTLAAIRVEEPWVFEESHREIKRWFDEGLVDGLRVDHPDGLRDPEGYLRDLAELTGGAYVLVEKILEPGEQLPTSWPTAGTTGYDALALVDRVLTDPAAEHALPFGDLDWAAMIRGTKRAVADGILGSEVNRLVRELPALGVPDEALRDALAEVIACFGVYRSYLPQGREHLDAAIAGARAARPELDAALDALAPVLADPAQPAAVRLQQTSGMVMAKGVEDCAFYRYPRLTSLTEVGGDPGVFALTPEEFHDAAARQQETWPASMTTLSTHDTKRGEDTRARITALAEVPQEWTAAFERLQQSAPVPDPAFADLLWQAALGARPAEHDPDWRSRLHAYAEKAMREAGDHTTWTAPDEEFEAAVHAAVDAAFDDPAVESVLAGLHGLVSAAGASNALSAKLIALTMPGVPDVYQGSELWEQSLVDPDNRRPVDFDARRHVLEHHDRAPAGWHRFDGAPAKLAVTAAALRLRRDRPELFGSYAPAEVRGPASDHLLAYDRGGAITLATRLPHGLHGRGGWADTELVLPAGVWWDVVTGRDLTSDGTVYVGEVLDVLPVALLVRDDSQEDQ